MHIQFPIGASGEQGALVFLQASVLVLVKVLDLAVSDVWAGVEHNAIEADLFPVGHFAHVASMLKPLLYPLPILLRIPVYQFQIILSL